MNTTTVPSVDWDTFTRRMIWNQGEHVTLIGPTGCGKTTIANMLLEMRQAVVVIATKPESVSLRRFARDFGYKIIRTWDDKPKFNRHDPRTHKIMLWPKLVRMGDVVGMRNEIYTAMADIFTTGNWCVYLDEMKYVSLQLKLKPLIDLFLLQGRELGISLVSATQRPAWIPLEVYDQSTHLFFWQERDRTNLDRMAGIASMDSQLIRDTVTKLDKHEFLYINTRTAKMVRSIAPAPKGG